ncbi:MAG: Flp pilus assembly complex ATPase component TadA [Myxococcales bacterium]|nr:Flp pilus assembly complex ATPase component TadA [Myxococcales bacterium]
MKVDAMLQELQTRGGTALHVRPGQPPLARLDGILTPIRKDELDGHKARELLAELVDEERRARFAADLDHTFVHTVDGVGAFEVALSHTAAGPAGVFRPIAAKPRTLTDLDAPEGAWVLAERTAGLVLVASPRGGGRSTTMAAIADHLNKTRAIHILTIEAPITMPIESKRAQVTQREVGRHTPSISAALRAASRDNVDAAFACDLDGPDAASVALDLALDGLLVVAGVVATDALSAIERLLAMFGREHEARARSLLADALAGVIAQQLLPAPSGPSRLPMWEVLVATPEIDAAIRAGRLAEIGGLIREGAAYGMVSLDASLESALADKKIDPAAALRRAWDREALAAFTR